MADLDNQIKEQADKVAFLEEMNAQLRAQIKALQSNNSAIQQLISSHLCFMKRIKIVTYATDLQWKPLFYQGAIEELSGYAENQFLNGLLKWEQLVHPEDLPVFLNHRQNFMENQNHTQAIEYRIISGEGQIYWLNDLSAMVYDENTQSKTIHGLLIDVTRRKLAEEELLDRQAHLDSILNSVQDVIWSVSPDTFELLYINPAAAKVYNFQPDGANSPIFGHDELLLEHFDILLSRGWFEAEFSIDLPNGEKRWLHRRAHFARDAHGLVARIDGIDTDITLRKQAEDALRYIGLHDSLTDLYNRFYFEEEMQQIDQNREQTAGIIVCDLNGLKETNDNLGHAAGDQLLIQCAQLYKKCFQANEIISRIGGDEFTILIKNCTSEELEASVASLRQAIVDFNNSQPSLPLSMSIGHALKSSPGISIHEVFRQADDMMYVDKFSKH
ncbi:MAG: diguanylate cyclase domain-containing protein [Methanobacterium sp.]